MLAFYYPVFGLKEVDSFLETLKFWRMLPGFLYILYSFPHNLSRVKVFGLLTEDRILSSACGLQ